MFDIDKFRSLLTTQWLGQEILYFKELDSTNSYLKSLAADKVGHGLLCLADHQTRGRGQYERSWESNPGENLTFTLAFKPVADNRFHVLTLACAFSMVQVLDKCSSARARIKWPNDVTLKGKKVGGLLTETMFNGNKLDRVLIGIGLNINQKVFSDGLQDKATSIRAQLDKKIDREQLLCNYLSHIEYEYNRWHKHSNELVKSINKNIIGYGKWIKLNINGSEWKERYKLLGINEKGQLVVIDPEGGIETFSYEQIRLITD